MFTPYPQTTDIRGEAQYIDDPPLCPLVDFRDTMTDPDIISLTKASRQQHGMPPPTPNTHSCTHADPAVIVPTKSRADSRTTFYSTLSNPRITNPPNPNNWTNHSNDSPEDAKSVAADAYYSVESGQQDHRSTHRGLTRESGLPQVGVRKSPLESTGTSLTHVLQTYSCVWREIYPLTPYMLLPPTPSTIFLWYTSHQTSLRPSLIPRYTQRRASISQGFSQETTSDLGSIRDLIYLCKLGGKNSPHL